MRYDEFKSWLEANTTLQAKPSSNAASRAQRIEQGLRINLDLEYQKDGGQYILKSLNYSTVDAAHRKMPPLGLVFKPGADIRNGMASLKAATKLYFAFCKTT